ncbi:hypothetical protein GWI33_020051 [Rhynchophorus ferrugineus]|uniref:Uncharacterized protein n=1 Tax=Rhynchophorus ferrugineus TaxID=354439 RepID=A0A834HSZ9_RHYFE|nr:hypothetical protein GWI33_020051 [Rhynchophorus ferrugineus]
MPSTIIPLMPSTPVQIPTKDSRSYNSHIKMFSLSRQTYLTPTMKGIYKQFIDIHKFSAKKKKKLASICKDRLKSLDHSKIFQDINSSTYSFLISQLKNQKRVPRGRRLQQERKLWM